MWINLLTAALILTILGVAAGLCVTFAAKDKKEKFIAFCITIFIAVVGPLIMRVDNRIFFVEKDIKNLEEDLKQLDQTCHSSEFISKASSNHDLSCEIKRRDIKYKIRQANEKRDWYLIQKFAD